MIRMTFSRPAEFWRCSKYVSSHDEAKIDIPSEAKIEYYGNKVEKSMAVVFNQGSAILQFRPGVK